MRLIVALTTLLLFSLPLTANAAQSTKAKQALIIDYETGQVLLAKDAQERMPTSSMSKVMTMYMVFDALKNGTITLDSTFKVSDKAWRKGGSKMFVEVNKEIKVKDLIRGVIVQSGNDATIVLAEGLAPSEGAFARSMTDKAKQIGMKNSNFMNASGWPDPDHYSTAEDLTIMAKNMIEEFPEYYKYYSEKEFTYNNIKQQNRNPLLYRNIGADGLKTGHTEAGGYGLIGTATADNRRVIMVVNGLESEKDRAEESARLIQWALNSFTNVDFAVAGQKISDANVAMGQADTVGLVIKDPIRLTMPKNALQTYTVDVKYNGPLVAPVKQGDEVGVMVIKIPEMENKEYPLFAQSDVKKIGFFKGLWRKTQYMVFGK